MCQKNRLVIVTIPAQPQDAHKILDDLEFVSENLNFSGGGGASVEGSSSAVAMVNATQPESIAHHDQVCSLTHFFSLLFVKITVLLHSRNSHVSVSDP